MKAITEKQPWGYLICAGIKDVENRTWPTKYRGRVLIHASAIRHNTSRLSDYENILTTNQMSEIEKHTSKWWRFIKLNHSAIIGSVEIIDCVKNHPSIWAEKDVYNWVLDKPVLFDNPIVGVKGKLSFWNWDEARHVPSIREIDELKTFWKDTDEIWEYWLGYCPVCGWMGLSRDMAGGEPIADTGDHSDCVCPVCNCHTNEIDCKPWKGQRNG